MIGVSMRLYDYYTYGDDDGYGQPTLSPTVQGTVKMAIFVTSQTIQDNINYKDAAYIGLTHADMDDTYVIQYGDKKLKVLYVQTQGRFNQIFLGEL